MRYLTADYIFPISSPPIKNGVVTIDDNGCIQEISSAASGHTSHPPAADSNLETHRGIICPGFINAHCHLELSYIKGAIPEKQGMAGFIKGLLSKRRSFQKEEILQAIEIAEQEMKSNGIVGVGDISNEDISFTQKGKGNLFYHTFFEVFDLDPAKADVVFSNALDLQKEYNEALNKANIKVSSSIVPHAPYTVSEKLLSLIANYQGNNIISYHNQESLAESKMYEDKTGEIAELFSSMGIKLDYIVKTGLNSLRSTLPYFSKHKKTLFVHNTYTSKGDIEWVAEYFDVRNLPTAAQAPLRQAGTKYEIRNPPETQNPKPKTQNPEHLKSQISNLISNVYYCLCPNANLYIENRLPDIDLFISEKAQIVIGTDSLASNHSLSVLEELKTITRHFHHIPLETQLKWATRNGAELFGWEDELGSLEPGKKPGLVLIENVNVENLCLTPQSQSKLLL